MPRPDRRRPLLSPTRQSTCAPLAPCPCSFPPFPRLSPHQTAGPWFARLRPLRLLRPHCEPVVRPILPISSILPTPRARGSRFRIRAKTRAGLRALSLRLTPEPTDCGPVVWRGALHFRRSECPWSVVCAARLAVRPSLSVRPRLRADKSFAYCPSLDTRTALLSTDCPHCAHYPQCANENEHGNRSYKDIPHCANVLTAAPCYTRPHENSYRCAGHTDPGP